MNYQDLKIYKSQSSSLEKAKSSTLSAPALAAFADSAARSLGAPCTRERARAWQIEVKEIGRATATAME